MKFYSIQGIQSSPLWRVAEDYLNIGGRTYRIEQIKGSQLYLRRCDNPRSLLSIVIKVISFFSIILPIIALFVRKLYRLQYTLDFVDDSRLDQVERDSLTTEAKGKKIVKNFWNIPSEPSLSKRHSIWDITDKILTSDSSLTSKETKQCIRETGRRIYFFHFQSDGFRIKAFANVPEQSDRLIYWCRGGNRTWAIPHPADRSFSHFANTTIVCTSCRGEPSEGVDQFGGDDVNEIKKLMDLFPNIAQEINLTINDNKVFILGRSRGGMQMTLALARFPDLQARVRGAISLSGLLDMDEIDTFRPDMMQMFREDFGMSTDPICQREWLTYRNPKLHLDKLSKKFPFLIVNAGKDIRVRPDEGTVFAKLMQERGHNVTVWNITDANHCLDDRLDVINSLVRWMDDSAKNI